MKEIVWCSKYGIKCQEFSTCREYFTSGGCKYQKRMLVFETEKGPEINIRWSAYTPYFRAEA